MKNDIDFKLILRYLEGSCTLEEREAVEQWIVSDPVRKEQLDTFRQIWDAPKKQKVEVDLEAAWRATASKARVLEKVAVKKPSVFHLPSYQHSVGRILRVAAVVVGLAGTSYLAIHYRSALLGSEQLVMREVATERGQRARVQFDDGTRVILNSASTMRFPAKFAGNIREVQLQGEAFFEVERNEESPFVVRAGDATVKVLGTGFNVRAWPDEARVEVVVAHGKVSVKSEWLPTSREAVLTKGEYTLMQKGEEPNLPKQVDVDLYLAWTEGRMEFQQTALSDVLRQLERRFDVKFVVTDSALLNKPLTASVSRESLGEVVQLLSISLDLHHTIKNGTVTLSDSGATKRSRN